MKLKIIYILFINIFLLSSFINSERVLVLSYSGLEPYLNKNNDTTYVINFWATWCKPCLEELPAFNELAEKYQDQKLCIILVSLDFPPQLKSQLIPFLKTNNIMSKVIVLDDPNSNYWINHVDSSWSGAIPATLIYNNNSREFYERSFLFNELDSIVKLKL